MRKLRVQSLRYFKKHIKQVVPESYVAFQKDTKPHVKRTMEDLKRESQLYSPRTAQKTLPPDFRPIPVSPTLEPILVTKPPLGKKLRWCSCGMSLRQPDCDSSCRGTAFQPIEFELMEPVFDVIYCGCKFSTLAPFCDVKTCKSLREQQAAVLQENEKDKNPSPS